MQWVCLKIIWTLLEGTVHFLRDMHSKLQFSVMMCKYLHECFMWLCAKIGIMLYSQFQVELHFNSAEMLEIWHNSLCNVVYYQTTIFAFNPFYSDNWFISTLIKLQGGLGQDQGLLQICGPWSRLKPVCLHHCTIFKNKAEKWHYLQWCRQHFQSAILCSCIQWAFIDGQHNKTDVVRPFNILNTHLTHYRQDTDLSVLLNNCKQAGAKTRAHISGPWPWLQPVCLKYYTSFEKLLP